jgi:hypothetical protein
MTQPHITTPSSESEAPESLSDPSDCCALARLISDSGTSSYRVLLVLCPSTADLSL